MRIELPTSEDASPKQQTVFAGAAAHILVKAGEGNVFAVIAHNANAAVRYLQFFDIASGVPSGAPLYAPIAVPAASGKEVTFVTNGLHFPNGITWGWSTTRDTYTAATPSEHATTVFYR